MQSQKVEDESVAIGDDHSQSNNRDSLMSNIAAVHRELDQMRQPTDSFLLFLAPSLDFDLIAEHPQPAHIIRLWQVYTANVDPLLKVTHVPTTQASIVDFIGNPHSTKPETQALIFAIYSMAVLSLDNDECVEKFSEMRSILLPKFQIACREALLRCHFLASQKRESLTALHLYLVSYTELRPAKSD